MHIGKPDSSDPKKTVFERSFVLGSGDLFVLGPRTNALHRHAIVPVPLEKAPERLCGAAPHLISGSRHCPARTFEESEETR